MQQTGKGFSLSEKPRYNTPQEAHSLKCRFYTTGFSDTIDCMEDLYEDDFVGEDIEYSEETSSATPVPRPLMSGVSQHRADALKAASSDLVSPMARGDSEPAAAERGTQQQSDRLASATASVPERKDPMQLSVASISSESSHEDSHGGPAAVLLSLIHI